MKRIITLIIALCCVLCTKAQTNESTDSLDKSDKTNHLHLAAKLLGANYTLRCSGSITTIDNEGESSFFSGQLLTIVSNRERKPGFIVWGSDLGTLMVLKCYFVIDSFCLDSGSIIANCLYENHNPIWIAIIEKKSDMDIIRNIAPILLAGKDKKIQCFMHFSDNE